MLIAYPCFRALPMFWNVASARDEISLRKWIGSTGYLRTFRGRIGCKNALCGLQCFFTHSINQGWANVFIGRVICRKTKTQASRKTSL